MLDVDRPFFFPVRSLWPSNFLNELERRTYDNLCFRLGSLAWDGGPQYAGTVVVPQVPVRRY